MDYTKATADEITQHASDIGEARRAQFADVGDYTMGIAELNAEAAILTNAIEALCYERDRLARKVALLARKVEELECVPDLDDSELSFRCQVDGGQAWAIWDREEQMIAGAYFGGVWFDFPHLPGEIADTIEAAVKRHIAQLECDE